MNIETKERWKRIPGYPRYLISNKGRVMSFTSGRHPEGKEREAKLTPKGYKIITMQSGTGRTEDNSGKQMFLHRIYAEAWIPVPKELKKYGKKNLQVDHIIPLSNGGDIFNPDGSLNLRWVTAKMNANNPYTRKNRERVVKERSMKVYQYDEQLNLINTFESTADAGRKLNKSQGNITRCCDGSLKRYLGYIFSYAPLKTMREREELEESKREKRKHVNQLIYKAIRKMQKKKKDKGEPYTWYQMHKEEANERAKEYYRRNREKILEKGRIRRAEAKEKGKTETVLPEKQGEAQ